MIRKDDKMKKGTIGYFILGSAIIWAVIIIGCSLALKGTSCYKEISIILAGGFISHLILIWGPLAAQLRKNQNS